MKNCFIIQPFDKGKYDRRYKDIIAPAVEECGLFPYRVDEDEYSKIPIQEIEKNIRESKLIIAEISTNNPNVWYELGYAFACNKDVIMICSEEREKFPFDVQHRTIIQYRSDSTSDFNKLHNTIVKKIKAYIDSQNKVAYFTNNLVLNTNGISPHEMYTLVTIMSQQFSKYDCIAKSTLVEKMKESGFNELATSIATKKLISKGLILIEQNEEEWYYVKKKYKIKFEKLVPLNL